MDTKNIIKYNTEYTVTYPEITMEFIIYKAQWYKNILYILTNEALFSTKNLIDYDLLYVLDEILEVNFLKIYSNKIYLLVNNNFIILNLSGDIINITYIKHNEVDFIDIFLFDNNNVLIGTNFRKDILQLHVLDENFNTINVLKYNYNYITHIIDENVIHLYIKGSTKNTLNKITVGNNFEIINEIKINYKSLGKNEEIINIVPRMFENYLLIAHYNTTTYVCQYTLCYINGNNLINVYSYNNGKDCVLVYFLDENDIMYTFNADKIKKIYG